MATLARLLTGPPARFPARPPVRSLASRAHTAVAFAAGVAITDAIQAFLLLFSFFTMPVFATYYWGGFNGIGGPRCENRQEHFTFGQPPPMLATSTDACYDGSEACARGVCMGRPPTAARHACCPPQRQPPLCPALLEPRDCASPARRMFIDQARLN